MIPERYRDLYIKVKDALNLTYGTGFATLTAFLKDKATLVQKHMPDRLIKGASKDLPNKQDLKKIRDLKAKLAKIKAKTDVNPTAKPSYNKELLEERVGKCPVCNVFHYFEARKGRAAGLTLASSFLTGYPKYMETNVEGRANIIVSKKACAVCTDWKHKRPACPYKRAKPCCEKDCKANHHTSLHGMTNPRGWL